MKTLNLCSPTFEAAESYGRIALEMTAQYEQMGLYVNQIGGEVPDGRRFKPVMGGLLLGYPTLWEMFTPLVHRGTRVAVTMFESTQLPRGWVERLNLADGVVVPAQWLVEVFRANGITVPIRVCPLGISQTFCQPVERKLAGPFTFIAFADRGWRKGWWHTLQAFTQAFGRSTDYKLILKTRNARMKEAFTNPNIEIVADELDDAGLVTLYQRCHVMVSANCAEGFGFLPREFAATGGLALATNWGGTADDLHWWGVPIPYEMGVAWPDDAAWKGHLGQWAEPDVDGLARLMRHVADHYTSYQDVALRGAGFVASHYRWSLFARQVYGFWQELEEARYARIGQPKDALSA